MKFRSRRNLEKYLALVRYIYRVTVEVRTNAF